MTAQMLELRSDSCSTSSLSMGEDPSAGHSEQDGVPQDFRDPPQTGRPSLTLKSPGDLLSSTWLGGSGGRPLGRPVRRESTSEEDDLCASAAVLRKLTRVSSDIRRRSSSTKFSWKELELSSKKLDAAHIKISQIDLSCLEDEGGELPLKSPYVRYNFKVEEQDCSKLELPTPKPDHTPRAWAKFATQRLPSRALSMNWDNQASEQQQLEHGTAHAQDIGPAGKAEHDRQPQWQNPEESEDVFQDEPTPGPRSCRGSGRWAKSSTRTLSFHGDPRTSLAKIAAEEEGRGKGGQDPPTHADVSNHTANLWRALRGMTPSFDGVPSFGPIMQQQESGGICQPLTSSEAAVSPSQHRKPLQDGTGQQTNLGTAMNTIQSHSTEAALCPSGGGRKVGISRLVRKMKNRCGRLLQSKGSGNRLTTT